ncbi:PREDICTED: transcription factor E2F7 [Gekko japonicus]|uniref:Transcription factor E2F7 n=1 Tax=Gekko japonicus TaxID=146911 RepID=A0ABM1JL02_GEKJA|nr:PREDICTED: transcription factor E2F7 [Gekko japonicus]
MPLRRGSGFGGAFEKAGKKVGEKIEMNCLTLKDLVSPRHTKVNFTDEDGENAQKENIFDRPKMAPKTPMKNEPIDLSKQKTYTPERNPITPVKLSDRPLTDPWTPTANLKMLISAASPDMRDREKKKELFRPIENSEFGGAFPDSLQCDAVDDGTADDYEKQRPSRKQKSLGLLCQKFLARYPSYPLSAEKTTISLDEVASSLGVERRRIYDIVNVLESLQLVSRVAKNQYCWHGLHSLSQTLKNLQEIGELQKYEELMAYFQHKEVDLECRFGEHKRETFIDFQDRQLLDFSETDCPSASANSRKDKSLRIMSQKFVMLFLVSKTKIVTLDIAAKILIEESQDIADHSKFKTKVRRLYDIANVLTSLGLIKKVHVTEERGRKPAFKWIGPVEFSADCDLKVNNSTCASLKEVKGEIRVPYQACVTGKERLSRHASFNNTQPAKVVKRKVSSEPSSPHRGRQEDCCSKMINLASVCCQKMEDDKSNFATERTKNLGMISPFPVLPVPGDSGYCLKTLPHLLTSACSDQPHLSLPNGMNDPAPPLPGLSASRTETGKSTVLSNQSLFYLPSPSLYMLCGNLHESLVSMEEKGIMGFQGQTSPHLPETTESPLDCRKRSSQKCASPPAASAEEEPTAKRQSMEQNDRPISLVLSKKTTKPMDPEASPDHNSNSIDQLRNFQVESGTPVVEATIKETAKPLETEEQEKPYRSKVLKENMNENEQASQENDKQSFLSQYLYVQPASGLNSFNFLFPANQSPDPASLPPSRLPSLSVPCVVVPSPALASFPLICSPAVTSQLSPAPAGSFPNVTCMNFSVPGLTSTAPVFIGTSAVLTPNASQLSTLDPHQQMHSSVRLSPMLGSACSSIKADSPACMGHHLTLLKLQQPSSAPVTPKSIRPIHQETFFKTPGSLEDPVAWRKNEGNQSRIASSVQRRLEIFSSSSD